MSSVSPEKKVKKKQKAVVIIPTYNERENVGPIVAALGDVFAQIKNWQMEVLIVDDTSPDKTYEVVRDLQKQYPFLHLLLNKQKSGLGGAYLKGMEEAFNNLEADVIFEFDADFSHDPKKIPELLARIDQGYDLVLGSRYVKGGKIPQDWGLHRKFLSVFGNIFIMTLMADFRIRDWTAGYRAIRKEVYEAVHPEMHTSRFTGYTFQIGFLHKTVRKGFKVAEVPIHFIDRTEGESKLGPEYIKNTLIYILKVRIHEIFEHRIFKFVMVGGLGSLVQLLSLTLLRQWIDDTQTMFLIGGTNGFAFTGYLTSFVIAIELAIITNFLLNNLWTFADRQLHLWQFPFKFLQFNLTSMGSLLIQFLVALVGERLIGLHLLFMLPIIGLPIDTGLLYAVLGILLGMFWNFFAYTTIIWKKK